jgi:organic hydroperoxide reductase OsmC/OhrA
MSQHGATIVWQRNGAAFTDNRYSRGHLWRFDGGIEVTASSSPHSVRVPMSVEAAVDPEEAFVAALSSCHMLWFLSLAAKRGFVVETYRDEAVGVLGTNADGKQAMTTVTLRPALEFSGDHRPSHEEIDALHHEAHQRCMIANSVTSEIHCEPVRQTV